MEQQTLKITGVLSDPTRFSIYQYVARQHRDVTVQEIADTFNIHANVARLHLTKLEDVNMLVSDTKKTGKGGRPSRFYTLSNEVVSLQFPYRDFQRLSEIAIETLSSLGKEGEKALVETGRKFGFESAKSFVHSLDQNAEEMSPREKVAFIEKVAITQGLSPEIHYDDENKEIVFRIYNCTFKELAKDNFGICRMHHALINGIFEYFFGDIKLKNESSLLQKNEITCTYTTIVLPKGE
ncbi:helix-turn-helix transcriptional regulator [Evansella cellulosilytica]|uniref:Putative transcriptional regulator n=1 Tax=Evansella cellulosilytica (strain ATCC 21833 / DSM 2522 / FERM P-1141 / JCM 9156 / N-4) TaxID=649639 RepID=E6TWY5_EVAC2|nr:helix-turn-helix domain-containing protein [Evansella cellulosilytica]ADU29935.1 putative transcriptional regulator [Evansella cellulosilytica DSM 2522]